MTITKIATRDARYKLKPGEGADSVHTDPQYAYATTLLETDGGITGSGLAFTLGGGNDLVCRAAELMAKPLVGREIEELMAGWGTIWRSMADHHQLRWLGAHKGVVHLALASITNACFDLWAKSRGVPLWNLLVNLSPQQIVATLDLSGLEDVLDAGQAQAILVANQPTRPGRATILEQGFPGYDTSVGWFHYADEQIRENARRALGEGFRAIKLKVGSKDPARDVRRAKIVRDTVGTEVDVMVDANQQWSLPAALRIAIDLAPMNPYWIEEPMHPDDVLAHQTLAHAIAPTRLALGEHVPNRILFKNFIQARAVHFVQVDAVRVGGVSEFITVSLLARKFGLPVVPHVGDMGQIHQHLVLFNRIALGIDAPFLEYIPHLREHFVNPAIVEGGRYRTPMEPGSSSDLK